MSQTEEIRLVSHSQTYFATVAPFGASLRAFGKTQPGPRERLWGYSGKENKKAGQGDVLMPFPGRIRGGRYTFEGKAHQLPLNDKEGPNSIHGFLRTREWQTLASTSNSARFGFEMRESEFGPQGYPFSLQILVEYSLSESGLRCRFEIENIGAGNAPVGAGFHPYFKLDQGSVDTWLLKLPAEQVLDYGGTLLPTGGILSVRGTSLDFREAREIGDLRFNHCFTGILRDEDGRARTLLRDPEAGEELEVWMDDAFEALVIYSGDAIGTPYARASLAIEPMTCASDAFNHVGWGTKVLKPREKFSGSWGVRA